MSSAPFDALEGSAAAESRALFESLVGVEWQGPGRTCEALILSTHPPSHGGTILGSPGEVPPPARVGNTEVAFNWVRPLNEDEREMSYVHVFDKNAQYLAAWSSLSVGLGGFQHGFSGMPAAHPGYWHVSPSEELYAHPWLPPPLRAGWAHTESVTLGHNVGIPFQWTDAFVWTESSRFLAKAYERLRAARMVLLENIADPRAEVALQALKSMYRVGTGRFGAGFRFQSPTRWLRPEWRHGIIAKANANLWRRLLKIATHRVYPFAIATDAICFASDFSDPSVFASSVELPVGVDLSCFKHVGSAPMSGAFVRARSALAVIKAVKA